MSHALTKIIEFGVAFKSQFAPAVYICYGIIMAEIISSCLSILFAIPASVKISCHPSRIMRVVVYIWKEILPVFKSLIRSYQVIILFQEQQS